MILKQVIHYPDTNSVEATWVRCLTEKEYYTGEDGEGCVLDVGEEVVIKCHSYADVQMDMFKADIAEFGGDITEFEELTALVESNIKPADPEPVIVPQVVSKAQGLLELYARGLLEQIETYMLTAPRLEQLAWNNIQQFERQSPLLNTLCTSFGLSQEDVDTLFVNASNVVI